MLHHALLAGKLNLGVLTSWQEGVSSSGDMGVRHVELVQSTRAAVVSDGVLAWRPVVLVACCLLLRLLTTTIRMLECVHTVRPVRQGSVHTHCTR
jgi:hypothetical protein